jgi:F-type H+-transporting ATPase subunit delta
VVSSRSSRYARAVFELAREEKAIGAWAKRLQAVREVIGHPEAQRILFNRGMPTAERVKAMDELATREMGKEGLNLARMLVATGRPDLIEGVVEEFERLADEAEGRIRATATTAVELSTADRKRISQDLSERLGKEVRLDVRVNPAILGGLVLQFGDRVIDASVATRLQQLRRRLATA